jgi:hypothetical protein
VKPGLLRIVEIARMSLENHNGNATFGRNAGYMGVREKDRQPRRGSSMTRNGITKQIVVAAPDSWR